MYKDKDVKENFKNISLSICDVKVFLTFTFTEYGSFDNYVTYFVPVLKYCYSDSRSL